MKNMHLFVFLLLLFPSIAWADTTPAPAREKLFNVEMFTLSNGMQVAVIPNHRAPVILQMVWYKTGNADEVHGKSGLAHFLEHLMFKGSPNIPPGEFSHRVRSMGGNDNAFTTADYTAYHETVSLSHLEDVMSMEADRMRAILVPANQFESERQVVLEERRMRTENNPQSWFTDQLRYALFPAHPYSVPVIGWKQEIEKLTRDDALAWHDKWYVPNNAILVVTGDISAEKLKPLAEKIYGSIPARPVTDTVLPPVNQFPGDIHLTLRDPRVRQSEFLRIYRVPSEKDNKVDSLALSVLEEIMSGNSTTRLYKSLVIDQKLATSAGFSYDDTARGPASAFAAVMPAENISLEKVEAAYNAEMQKVADNGVTPEELSEAKTRMKDSSVFIRDSLSESAHIVGAALASGVSLDDIEYWVSDIDTVTAAQIQAVAKKYLLAAEQDQNYVTGYIIATEPKPGQPAPPPLPAQEEVR
jgi:zinc protease